MHLVECKPNRDVTPDIIEKIAALKSTGWPYPIESQIAWLRDRMAPDDMHFMIWDGDQLITYMSLAWRKTISGTRIAGLGTLVTHPDRQKQGLGRTLFLAGTEVIVAAKWSGLYWCPAEHVHRYRPCGWRECTVQIQSQDGKTLFPELIPMCIGPFDERETVTLLGDRF